LGLRAGTNAERIPQVDCGIDIAAGSGECLAQFIVIVCDQIDGPSGNVLRAGVRSVLRSNCTRHLASVPSEQEGGAGSTGIADHRERMSRCIVEDSRKCWPSEAGQVGGNNDQPVGIIGLSGHRFSGELDCGVQASVGTGDVLAVGNQRLGIAFLHHDNGLNRGRGAHGGNGVQRHRSGDAGTVAGWRKASLRRVDLLHRHDRDPIHEGIQDHDHSWQGTDMASRVRRRWRLGFWYRVAVVILWPFMTVFTKHDYRGGEFLQAEPGGIVVAPNHLTWFDPVVIAHALWVNDRPPRFLAKESIFRVPVVGRIVDGAGQIRVYRESRDAARAVRDAVTGVEAGECVVIYPEGTITRDPGLWPMAAKSGAVRVALQSGSPLIPMAQWGSQKVMGPYAKEFKILPRKTMEVRFGPPIDLDDLRDRPITTDVLAIGNARLMAAITHLLEEIRGEAAPTERLVYRRPEQA